MAGAAMAENMNNEASSCLITAVSPFKPFSMIIILVAPGADSL
jgi:hypothetical protein